MKASVLITKEIRNFWIKRMQAIQPELKALKEKDKLRPSKRKEQSSPQERAVEMAAREVDEGGELRHEIKKTRTKGPTDEEELPDFDDDGEFDDATGRAPKIGWKKLSEVFKIKKSLTLLRVSKKEY